MKTRLSALVVNYNSGAFAEACVASLVHEWLAAGYERELLGVVVVDNDSPHDQEVHLARLEEAGHTVVRSAENLGYSGGMNLALEQTDDELAEPDDLIAILNPDLFFLPGSVKALVEYTRSHLDVGAVDPRAFIDPDCGLNLPRNLLPTILDHTWMALAQMSPWVCRAYSRHRLKKALPWWSAEGPLEAEMLSGACLFLRRGTVRSLPHLMDPRYPLYYEDTDLVRELSKRGLKLIHHGGANVLHHWSRSTGLTGDNDSEAMRRYAVSQIEYYRKFYGRFGVAWIRLVNWANAHFPRNLHNREMHPVEALGAFEQPIEVSLPRSCHFLVEMGMAPNLLLAAGLFGEGQRWVCPPRTWDWFFEARYFMRILDRDTGELLGSWSFEKTVPGRDEPMRLDEIGAR